MKQIERGAFAGNAGAGFQIKKGLDLPLDGAPGTSIEDGPEIASVAVIGTDFIGLKPKMLVEEGEVVSLGQPLFADKRFDGVVMTAPAGGRVQAINRGARRILESVVIAIDEKADAVSFGGHGEKKLGELSADAVKTKLLKSGLWACMRARPYSKIPDPATTPAAIFVTAIDTRPLAADPATIIADDPEHFTIGLSLIARLTEGTTYVCHAPGADLPEADIGNVRYASFAGPHPAGLVGTHIHHLDPVNAEKTVWYLGYQDVIAIGRLFRTGRLPTERIVAMSGPAASKPSLLRTRIGAYIPDLVGANSTGNGATKEDGDVRIISGDVLSGHTAADAYGFLGRFHQQVTLMPEGNQREAFGWVIPSVRKFATANVHLSSLFGLDKVKLTTSLQGSPRAMVPIGLFEDVMPLDILATQLLRALLVMDTDDAQALGALELDEEDLALCSYVCMSKYEYGVALRACLDKIEAEG
ncbi:MAG: Na(+)-translocating NADH-quinone reductase subunit A [Pseudomonadota bacterium]